MFVGMFWGLGGAPLPDTGSSVVVISSAAVIVHCVFCIKNHFRRYAIIKL